MQIAAAGKLGSIYGAAIGIGYTAKNTWSTMESRETMMGSEHGAGTDVGRGRGRIRRRRPRRTGGTVGLHCRSMEQGNNKA